VGKLAVALYAVMVVNVVAGLLKPGRAYLEDLCNVPVPQQVAIPDKRETKISESKQD
jgi:hypothetical protein